MHCPFCGAVDTKVIDSRLASEGNLVRRRRECITCEERFTTYESAELVMPRIIKQDGIREPFNEDKLFAGLSKALEKSLNLLKIKGKIIIVSFHSLEDKLVKDFFNHNSGKRWRSSRHYPELADDGPITLKLITKKPIRPSDLETNINPRSRSAKLRVAEKISIN